MSLKTLIKNAYQNVVAGLASRRRQDLLKNQILNDISQFIKKNCPRMSLNEEYRKKLVQSINIALTHAADMIARFPGPVDLDPESWEDQPVIHSLFLNPEQIHAVLKSSKDLKRFFQNTSEHEAIALLTSSLHEKTVFTSEKNGEMVRRDVPKKAIYFDDHQILAPAQHISETQHKIQHLALTSLCRNIFKETTDLQAWKNELEAQQKLLEFNINIGSETDDGQNIQEAEQLLSDIKNKILSINNQVNVTGEHLDRITQIFESPENICLLKQKN